MSSPPTSPSPDDQESLDEKRSMKHIKTKLIKLTDLREKNYEKYKEQIAKGYLLKR